VVSEQGGTLDVVDEPARDRFVIELDGKEAVLQYRLNGNRLVLIHTEVPEELGGQGLGGRLVRAATDRAAREQLTIVPVCPYARRWMQEHPDVTAGLLVDWNS
jgi:predicted GNAT family acetyltransferase